MFITRRRPLLFRSLPLALALLGLACGTGSSDAGTTAGASTVDANPSLHCVLEYQTGQGVFGLAGEASGDLNGGVTARSASSAYALAVTASPSGGTGLSVQASIVGASGAPLAYVVLARSAFSGSDYAFELGAQIPPLHAPGYDGQDHEFDGIRGYCKATGTGGGGPGQDGGLPQTDLDPKYFDPGLPEDGFFHRQNPDPAKVSLARLDALLAQAAQQESDGVVIALDDVIIAEKYFGKGAQIAPVMSVTKTVTSLAIGALIDEGKIASVDVPLSTYFPEWSAAPKATATLRHLLTMTAGIQDTDDFWNHDDLLAYAKTQPLVSSPGAVYSYSNESAMLFAGIIAQAAGMPVDQYVTRKFFAPLGITDAFWAQDGAGNVQTPGGLSMTPRDLLRIGTLASHGGTWGNDRLISASWLTTSTANQTPLEACYGYLWWVVRPGCDGEHFGTSSVDTPVQGFFADGWGGNYAAVIPSAHLVAVRTKYPGATATPDDELRTRYLGFTQDAAGLRAP